MTDRKVESAEPGPSGSGGPTPPVGLVPPVCPACEQGVTGDPSVCPACGTMYHRLCLKARPCLVRGCLSRQPRGGAATFYSPKWWWATRFNFVVAAMVAGAILRSRGEHLVPAFVLAGLFFAMIFLAAVTTWAACYEDIRQSTRDGAPRPDRHGTDAILLHASWVLLWCLAVPLQMIGNRDVAGVLVVVVGACMLVLFLVANLRALSGLARDRRKLRAFAGTSALVLAAGACAIGSSSNGSARNRANTRACYANQKTVVGAVEMYNLDRNTKVVALDGIWSSLRSGGYLQSIPVDPGQGAGTSGHYVLTGTGNGITCETHGPIQ